MISLFSRFLVFFSGNFIYNCKRFLFACQGKTEDEKEQPFDCSFLFLLDPRGFQSPSHHPTKDQEIIFKRTDPIDRQMIVKITEEMISTDPNPT